MQGLAYSEIIIWPIRSLSNHLASDIKLRPTSTIFLINPTKTGTFSGRLDRGSRLTRKI